MTAKDGAGDFLSTFGGNPSAYAVQHFDNGDQWYEPVRRPLTESIVEDHLDGEMTVGVYPLDVDLVHFATIDIDLDDERLWASARQDVSSIHAYAKELGVALLIEDSGNRGYHLHALFSEPVQAKRARRLMRVFADRVAVPRQAGVGLEIFPKQDIAEDLGNPVKLPCGVHQKTQRRSTIINQDFEPVGQPIRTIVEWPRVDSAAVEDILNSHPEPEPHARHANDGAIASGYDEDGEPGLAVERCSFLSEQLDNPYQTYDEWVAALSIMLPFGETGSAWAHKLSESYEDYTPEETDDKIASLRADGMSPWSCATIRERFGKCPDECVLEPLGDTEPSPVRLCHPAAGSIKTGCVVSSEQNRFHEDANPNIAELLPSKSFLKDYVEFASPITEAPEIFHVFVGLAVMSIVVNRQIYITFGDIRILPNLWVVLIAPTSYFRKTTAISIGTGILRDYNAELILPSDFSAEALTETLEKSPIGLLVHYEFQSLLGQLERSYMSGAKALLTELYDCPAAYTRKLKKSTATLERPFLSMIAATTSEWLTAKTKNRDVQSGFLARCMFVPVSAKEKTLIIPPKADKNLRLNLLNQLREVSLVSGEVDLSLIKTQHEDYVRRLRGSVADGDATMAGFLARLEINLLKIAALIEVSCSGGLAISPESHLIASRIIDYLADSLRQHVMKDLMATEDEQLIEKIKAFIGKNPGCSRKMILQYCNIDSKRAWQLVTTLEESGEIVVETRGKGKYHYLAGYKDIPEDPEGGVCP